MSIQNFIKKYTDHSIFIDYSRIESVSMESLNNGLSEEENKRLFTTPFLEEIIYLISRGLRNLYPKPHESSEQLLNEIYNIFTSNTRTKEEHKIYLLSIEILILKICPTLRHNSQLKLLN